MSKNAVYKRNVCKMCKTLTLNSHNSFNFWVHTVKGGSLEWPRAEYAESGVFSKYFIGRGRERGKSKNLYLKFDSFIRGKSDFTYKFVKMKNSIIRKIYEIF